MTIKFFQSSYKRVDNYLLICSFLCGLCVGIISILGLFDDLINKNVELYEKLNKQISNTINEEIFKINFKNARAVL